MTLTIEHTSFSFLRSKACLPQFLLMLPSFYAYPASMYLLKVNNGNTTILCDIRSKLTMETQGRRHWHTSGVCIVNFEQISDIVLKFPLLTLNY